MKSVISRPATFKEITIQSEDVLHLWLEHGWRVETIDDVAVDGQCLRCGRLLLGGRTGYYCGSGPDDDSNCLPGDGFPVSDCWPVRKEEVLIPLMGGGMFPLFNPGLEDIPDIEVFSHSLAVQCRWTGHTGRRIDASDGADCLDPRWVPVSYSIAEHCVRGSRECPEELAFVFLCHDLAEALFHDVSRRVRGLFQEYEAAHRRVDCLIAEKFGFDVGLLEHPAVMECDERMAATEALAFGLEHAGVEEEPFTGVSMMGWPWNPILAKRIFLGRFKELKAK